MGIFGAIKNKFLHKEEDFTDIRSHVLGEPDNTGLPLPPGPGMRPGEERMVPEPVNVPEPNMQEPVDDLGVGDLSRPVDNTQDMPVGPVEEDIGRSFDNERDIREIIHRLDFIENQLSAVKSQTETVNERLKNIEVKIDRRYR